MKLCILTREDNYSTRRLVEAARARGHHIRSLDTMRLSMMLERGAPRLFYNQKPLGHFDAVIPRIGASITFYGTAVIRQFEQMGVFTLAASHAITVSRDKLRSLQVLSRHDIGLPPTAFAREPSEVMPAIERLGGAPVIIKVLEGTQGIGVILADNEGVALAIIETLQSVKQNVLIQKFVAESRGRDIRAIVVGGRVVAAMRRVATGDEFRSNVHRGGRTESVPLDREYRRTAVRAAQIMGLRFAGVDMLETRDGPQVMEVNSSPGLEGIEQATGVDVASAVIELIEEEVQFPEIDVRQRLTLEKGYGVADLPVGGGSELAGVTVALSGLADLGIRVLSIQRGSLTYPNPSSEETIRAGDVLLCFGKLIALKPLLPKRKRRSRAPVSDGSGPDPNGPDYSGPDYSGPDYSGPDHSD
jgi:ribosomal protein S6--L-glutamate ligase